MATDGGKPSGWLDDLYFQVGNRLAQSTATEAAVSVADSEGFSLSREHAEQLVKRLNKILDQLTDLQGIAMNFSQMKPPADDPVSRRFNDAVAGHGSQRGVLIDGAGHIQREIAYLRELRFRLTEALGDTVTTDQHNKDNFRAL